MREWLCRSLSLNRLRRPGLPRSLLSGAIAVITQWSGAEREAPAPRTHHKEKRVGIYRYREETEYGL